MSEKWHSTVEAAVKRARRSIPDGWTLDTAPNTEDADLVIAYLADRLEAASALPQGWQRVSEAHPAPHARYLVRRDGFWFTATPCYGMHSPWWVVRTMAENYPGIEAEPVDFRPTDEWMPLPAPPASSI